MNAVGADQKVRCGPRAVFEPRDDALARLLQTYELVARMQTLLRQRIGEKLHEIRAMEVVVRRTERRLDLGPERSVLQHPSIFPAPLMHGAWSHAGGVHRGPEG